MQTHKIFLILLVASMFNLNCWAESPIDSVRGSDWRNHLSNDLTDELCAATGYVPSCFAIPKEDCRTRVNTDFQTCTASIKIPAKVQPLAEGISLAYKIGQCVGIKVEQKLSQQKVKNEKCNDRDNWM
jgi:hypothetical protein